MLVIDKATDQKKHITINLIIGIFTIPMIFGLFFIYYALRYKKLTTYTELYTDRRYVAINGEGKVTASMPWGTVTKLTRVSQRGTGQSWLTITCKPPATVKYVTLKSPASFQSGKGEVIGFVDFLQRHDQPAFLASLVPKGLAAAA